MKLSTRKMMDSFKEIREEFNLDGDYVVRKLYRRQLKETRYNLQIQRFARTAVTPQSLKQRMNQT